MIRPDRIPYQELSYTHVLEGTGKYLHQRLPYGQPMGT
jgi:hypothetical protein